MPYKVVRYKALDAETIRSLNTWESKGWRVISHSIGGFQQGWDKLKHVSVILHMEEVEG